MRCLRCQHENPPGMKFCGECAAPLASTCPSCGAAKLLRGVKGARTGLVRLEILTEEELVGLEREFEALQRSRQSGPTGPPGKA